MRKRNLTMLFVVGALVGAFALGQARGQEPGEGEAPGGDMADMAAWMELGTPGPQHAEMQKMVGTWNCTAKSWMQPGADPIVDEGKCTFSMVLGGRIMKQEYEGAMAGTPFTGLGFTAFNKATEQYESIWMDSMSTGIFMMTGEETDDETVFEYTGSFYGPGGVEVETRTLMRKVSDDEQVMEMHHDMGAGMVKAMELTYRRAE